LVLQALQNLNHNRTIPTSDTPPAVTRTLPVPGGEPVPVVVEDEVTTGTETSEQADGTDGLIRVIENIEGFT